jgi:hypothetical protein
MDRNTDPKIFLYMLIINIALTTVISALPGSSLLGKSISNQLQSEVPSPSSNYLVSGAYIGMHNFLLALGMSIPFVGLAWGLFVLGDTAYAFASLGAMNKVPGVLLASNEAFLPFFWFEFICYSVMMGESFILGRAITKGNLNKSILRDYAFIVVGVGLTLLISGYVEAAFINLETSLGI